MGSWQKEKIILFIVMIGCVLHSFGQEDASQKKQSFIQPGLLSASATMAPTDMINRKDVNYYLSGFFEGKVTKHIGIRGDIHYLLPNDASKLLKNNLRVFIGLQYGFSFGNFETHIGFAPGFGVMQSHRNTAIKEFMPTVQFNVGFRYYVWNYFHFFANVQYVHSKMNRLTAINGLADEMVYSVGLGFNFQALKKNR